VALADERRIFSDPGLLISAFQHALIDPFVHKLDAKPVPQATITSRCDAIAKQTTQISK
jgi:hypothetical protein